MKYLVISVGIGRAVHESVPAKRDAFNWFRSRRNSHSPVTDTSSHASAMLADWQVRMLLHNGNLVRTDNYLYIQALVRTYICTSDQPHYPSSRLSSLLCTYI